MQKIHTKKKIVINSEALKIEQSNPRYCIYKAKFLPLGYTHSHQAHSTQVFPLFFVDSASITFTLTIISKS